MNLMKNPFYQYINTNEFNENPFYQFINNHVILCTKENKIWQ